MTLSRPWVGRLVPVVAVVAAWITLDLAGRGVQRRELAFSWQLVDLDVLGNDIAGSLWHLHTQPPLHNLLVGLVLAGPLPVDGTLFVLYGATLVASALLLHDTLVRLGTGPIVAGVVAAFALIQPGLLDTIYLMSYEVPVATLLVGALWAVVRYMETPTMRWLLVIATILTLAALTRSLLHPVWVFMVLGVCWVAGRATKRQVLASAAIPVVLLGGWMAKNQLVYQTPTLSSWQGFNLQRGVVASMERDVVERDVAQGHVSSLALEYPWGHPDDYAAWADGCRPEHHHAAASATDKTPYGTLVPSNYNYECLLPVYDQAGSDAVTLIRRHPGRYLSTRTAALALSFDVPDFTGDDHPAYDMRSTWLNELMLPLHLRVTHTIDMRDWNLPFYVLDEFVVKVSLLLVGCTLFLVGRGVLAAVRLARRWGDRGSWPLVPCPATFALSTASQGRRSQGRRAQEGRSLSMPEDAASGVTGRRGSSPMLPDRALHEVAWLVATITVLWVVVAGDLVELGENSRFRAALDPLLLALPLAALGRGIGEQIARRRDPTTAVTGSGDS